MLVMFLKLAITQYNDYTGLDFLNTIQFGGGFILTFLIFL